MRVLAAASTKAPPKETTPESVKVSVAVPTPLLRTVWSPATPRVDRVLKDLLKPLSSSVALLPALPRTTSVELAQAAVEPMTRVPFSTLVAPE